MSSSGVFGPAPAGTDLSENQDGQIFGAVVTLMVLATVFVTIRIFTRVFARNGGMAADDYLILVGWVSPSETGELRSLTDLVIAFHNRHRCLLLDLHQVRVRQAPVGVDHIRLRKHLQNTVLLRVSLRHRCQFYQAVHPHVLPSYLWRHTRFLGMPCPRSWLLGCDCYCVGQCLQTHPLLLVQVHYRYDGLLLQ
jgi:hypothetical protein